MQRRIAFGLHSQHDSNAVRSRNRHPTILLSTDAMTLLDDGAVSGWRSLLWFWLGVGSIAAIGGVVLTILGPMPDPDRGGPPAPPRPAAVTPAPANPPANLPVRPAMAVAIEPPVATPPATIAPPTIAPRAPQPDPQPPRRRSLPDPQAPGSAAQQDAPPRSQTRIVLHPARPDGAGAIAGRLTDRVGLAPGQVDVGTAAEPRSEVSIRFYSESDHATARRVGQELARMGYSWRLDNRTGRASAPSDPVIEVWLTDR